MDDRLVLTQVVAAAAQHPHQAPLRLRGARGHGDARADPLPVGGRPLQAELQPAVRPRGSRPVGPVAVQHRAAAVVHHEEVEVAVRLQVEDRQPGADAGRRKPLLLRHLAEPAVAVVAPEPHRVVGEAAGVGGVGDLAGVVDAGGQHQVEIAVVVVVQEGGAPSPRSVPHPRRIGDVLEDAVALVAVQAVAVAVRHAFLVDGAHEPVEVAVAVVIAHGRAHAVLVGADPRPPGDVDEAPVAPIPVELAGGVVAGDHQLGIEVVVEQGEAGGEGLALGQRIDGDDAVLGDAGAAGHVLEPARRLRPPVAQQPRIALRAVGHLAQEAPLGGVQVQEAVQVVVPERGAEPEVQVRAFDGRPARHRFFGKRAGAVVHEQVEAVREEAGHVQVEVAVVVDVAPGGAVGLHAGQVSGAEGGVGDVREGAVAAVPVQDVGVVQAGDVQIDQSVAVIVAGRHPAGRVALHGRRGGRRTPELHVVDAGGVRHVYEGLRRRGRGGGEGGPGRRGAEPRSDHS